MRQHSYYIDWCLRTKERRQSRPKLVVSSMWHITWGLTLSSWTCLLGQDSPLQADHSVHGEQHGFGSQLLDQPVSHLSARIWGLTFSLDSSLLYSSQFTLAAFWGYQNLMKPMCLPDNSETHPSDQVSCPEELEHCILMCSSVEMAQGTQGSQASPPQGASVGVSLSGT